MIPRIRTGAAVVIAAAMMATALLAQTAAPEVRPEVRPQARPASLIVPQQTTPSSETSSETAPDTDTTTGTTTNTTTDTTGATPDIAASETEPTPASVTPAPEPAPERDPGLGPETNLPLPRFVSLKTDEGNVRRGPSLSHRIDWVFLRRDMPLQIVAEYGHWRRVIDREGLGGWVHYALLSGTRTVIVDQNLLPLRTRPVDTAPESAQLEAGVIARLGECNPDWCRISAGGYRGWAPKSALWGVGADEIRE